MYPVYWSLSTNLGEQKAEPYKRTEKAVEIQVKVAIFLKTDWKRGFWRA